MMTQPPLGNLLPELNQIEFLIAQSDGTLDVKIIKEVAYRDRHIPIYALSIGSKDPSAPSVAFVGGVHGLEKIGTQVVLAYLETVLARAQWDITQRHALEHLRIHFIPLVNPIGMANNTRSNGNGVDLMRNAPVDSDERTPWLIGGHRISNRLPWYRGKEDDGLEVENEVLSHYIEKYIFPSPFSIILDCHSGFGVHDRIWFPYAKSRNTPVKHLGELYHLRDLFFQTYPHQNYIFEPQSRQYITHGDIWDYLYDKAIADERLVLPLTLEMGSWRWVRKNPSQLRRILGLYHPIKPHRVQRVLRAHLVLMDFLVRAALSHENWLTDCQSLNMGQKARELWY